jgi:hypothetical protein
MTRSFSELTKNFDPERRERIEQRKEEIRHVVEQSENRNYSDDISKSKQTGE